MVQLYKYIFTKAYFFCINYFKEKEFPQYFATGSVTLLATATLYVLLSIVEYVMLPIRFNFYGEYYKYFALVVFAIALIYVNRKKRYLKIIDQINSVSERKQKKLKIVAISYMLSLLLLFFQLSTLIRNYNIMH